ncbi:MAG TPA: CRTAC1 family protein [Candidatus Sulfotelmatobacter sp.]|nr:CRTAC1 family protein [Candidatus Sulfotelmatobacter sp.]
MAAAPQPPSPQPEQKAAEKPSRPSGPIEFTDITAQAGIRFKHNSGAFGKKYLPETMGSGVCFIDYDNDGWQDILLVNSMDWPGHASSKSFPALYHNNHDGTFTDVTRQAGLAVEMYGLGCTVGDYDNDGFDDIYITTVGSNHLFHNLRNGKFADVTGKAGVADPGFSASAVWFDFDNDGKLDLFVAHYIDWSIQTDQYCSLDNKNKSYCTPQTYKGQSSSLFRNKGDGTFENVTKRAGLYDPTSKSLGIALLDYDNDGWTDLFVSNDTEPNKLYHNNHNGTFSDVGLAAGLAYSEAGTVRAGMGTDAADYDNSGWQSLVIGNFTNEGMALYHNDGSGLFTDEAPKTGISRLSTKSLTFGTFFFDYDLDGLQDILAINGHVSDDISVVQPNVKYAQPPHLFRNLGKNKFEEVTAKVGPAMQRPIVGRGAAYADIDNDGDLDLVITANNGAARLLRNDNGNQNDTLRIKTVGTRSNRDGIGAKVTVKTSKGARLFAMVKTGSSYLSQSELPLTFGLGKPEEGKTVSVEIVWPSGQKDTLSAVKANQYITVKEGKGIISAQPIPVAPASPKK